MTTFVLSSLYNKFLLSSLENPGMFPPQCMPECFIFSTVNRRQIFLSGLLNISFQNSLYNQCHSTTYCPLNCLQLWKELLGSAPDCQPPLLLVFTIKHWRFLCLLLHWPTARFPNPAVRSSDPLRLRCSCSRESSFLLALTQLHHSSKGTMQVFCETWNRHQLSGKVSVKKQQPPSASLLFLRQIKSSSLSLVWNISMYWSPTFHSF